VKDKVEDFINMLFAWFANKEHHPLNTRDPRILVIKTLDEFEDYIKSGY
jgi:hypothetical protein